MFSWETLGHGIHMDGTLTATAHLNISVDQTPSMGKTIFNSSAHAKWENASYHPCKALMWSPNPTDPNLIDHLKDALERAWYTEAQRTRCQHPSARHPKTPAETQWLAIPHLIHSSLCVCLWRQRCFDWALCMCQRCIGQGWQKSYEDH